MLSQFSIDGDVAIVTGASGGIGKAIAARFADDGVNVVINSREQERVDAAAEDILAEDPDGDVLPLECDVRDRDGVFDLVDQVVDEYGGVDILVNNAAGDFVADFEDLSENAWKTIIDINLHGTFNFTQAAGEVMRENGGGYIINLSSVAGLPGGSPGSSHYGASKAAVINLTESLSQEWDEYDIRVSCIAPGLVATPGVRTQLGIDPDEVPPREPVVRSIGRPEEIADIAQFLCSPAASFISGETIVAGVPQARGWGDGEEGEH